MKKYEITIEHPIFPWLHNIRALITIPGVVNAGELGGWIATEDNLSHEGKCWVADNAKVYGDAKIAGNALIADRAEVSGNAQVFGDAQVHDEALVSGNAQVYDSARVCDDANVRGDATVSGSATVYGKALVTGDADVSGDARVSGRALIRSKSQVFSNDHVSGDTKVCGNDISTLEKILSAIKEADQVRQCDDEGDEEATFVNSTPEPGDPDSLILAFGGHTQITITDLESAELLDDADGNVFKLGQATYRLFKTTPVRIDG
jgi:carbonic anhydrase/acetyltransferase-like protein (isoleucine patch superfamily)